MPAAAPEADRLAFTTSLAFSRHGGRAAAAEATALATRATFLGDKYILATITARWLDGHS